MASNSTIPKKFSFTIPRNPEKLTFTAEYVDKLTNASTSENGKKGYIVMWRDKDRSGSTGYLLKDVEMCIREGLWIIVDDKEKK